MKFELKKLPPENDVESKSVLKLCANAHRHLAELKGISQTIPNQVILINTLPMLEAKDSSAIENIITTNDDMFKEDLFGDFLSNSSAKEVKNYTTALKKGFELVKDNNLLLNRHILEVQEIIEHNKAGFRKLPGTDLRNLETDEIVYTPPQHFDEISDLMSNLETFINDDGICQFDPLVKMAIIHYQFESIHPFYDGNGRTGRIINILFLVLKGLLDIPILYLSRYIIKNKSNYYKLLQNVRDNSNWEEWISFILAGIAEVSKETIDIINSIKKLMLEYKHSIREKYNFYSQDLINNLFKHPYTKIDFLENDIKVSRQTAAKYLDQLSEDGFLKKEKIGNNNYYVNEPLFRLFNK